MKKPILILFFVVFWFSEICFSQGFPAFTKDASIANPPLPFVFDGNGKPLYWGSAYTAEGSPYFYDDYRRADIILKSGKIYTGIKVKFNLLERQVQYLSKDSTEMVTDLAVESIKFTSISENNDTLGIAKLVSNNGILNSPGAVVYEVIDSGKVSLLKKITVTYRDETQYGSTKTTRYFIRKDNEYFVFVNDEYKKLEKSRAFLTTLLQDQKSEVDDFINKNKINCKSLKGCQQVIRYYNSLFP